MGWGSREHGVVTEQPAPPSGTIAFLFTDVEGSTVLWEQHREAMALALERHDQILRSVVDTHGGYVFSTAGDAFSVAFARPVDAIAAAVEAQRALGAEAWPEGVELRVRMGAHAGTAQERDGDYFGPALNRAARVMSLAQGGQVLVTLALEELVRDELLDDVSLVPLGERELRGLSRAEMVYGLSGRGLATDFELAGGETSVPGNLPSPPTSFVGRVDDLKRLAATVPQHRVTTLVGPGGVGKTRLAIETAAELVDEYPDGCWFVQLAPLADPDAVVHTIASTLAITPEPGSTLLDSVVNAVRRRRLLLVLDNCEHLVDAAAEAAGAIAAATSTASVLATSRESLGVGGEQAWPVAPLDPALEAADLFVERAQAINPVFTVAGSELDDLRELCRHLDGMPLAVELAAGRTKAMTVAEIAERVDDRFRLLRGSRRSGADTRQQTLLATVEWSYQLLEADEQLVFGRLSVFAGGFDLTAAQQVCSDEHLDELDVVDVLEALVDRSMVRADQSGPTTRFSLLETLRQYGHDRLTERDELTTTQHRHLDHYVTVAARARDMFEGAANAAGRELLELEWDNIREAFDVAHRDGEVDAANALIAHSFWFAWYFVRDEHERWLRRHLASRASENPEMLGRAGLWAVTLGDLTEGESLGRRAIAAAPSPAHGTAAYGWAALNWAVWYLGRRDEALEVDRAAKRSGANCNDRFTALAVALWVHPTVAFEPDNAPAVIANAARYAEGLDNDTLEAVLGTHKGHGLLAVGDGHAALAAWRHTAERAARAHTTSTEAYALAALAIRSPAITGEDPAGLYVEAITRLHALHAGSYLSWAFTGLADWWAHNGRVHDAATIIGYLDQNYPGGNQTYADVRESATRAVDAEPEATAWREAGARLETDEIVAYCLDRLDDPLDTGQPR